MAERLQKFVKSYHERGQNDSVNKVQISWLLNSNKFWTVVAVVTSHFEHMGFSWFIN